MTRARGWSPRGETLLATLGNHPPMHILGSTDAWSDQIKMDRRVALRHIARFQPRDGDLLIAGRAQQR
jgi:hypothetical protein